MWWLADQINNADWQDVLIAYVPVVLIVLGGFGFTRNHLNKQDKLATKRADSKDQKLDKLTDQHNEIRDELAYIKDCVNGEGFDKKTGYKL